MALSKVQKVEFKLNKKSVPGFSAFIPGYYFCFLHIPAKLLKVNHDKNTSVIFKQKIRVNCGTNIQNKENLVQAFKIRKNGEKPRTKRRENNSHLQICQF